MKVKFFAPDVIKHFLSVFQSLIRQTGTHTQDFCKIFFLIHFQHGKIFCWKIVFFQKMLCFGIYPITICEYLDLR